MENLVQTIRNYLNDRGRVAKVYYDEDEDCIMVKEPDKLQYLSRNFVSSVLLFSDVMETGEFISKLLSD